MNPTYLPALAALSGSAVGGLTSFLSSWLGQSAQLRAQVFLNDKSRRQELYREFVDEASKGYIDSITTNTPDLTRLVALYSLISRMRSLSSPNVIEEAEKVAQLIVGSTSATADRAARRKTVKGSRRGACHAKPIVRN